MKNENKKLIRFLDMNNEHIFEEPADFISMHEMIPDNKLSIQGGAFFSAMKKIFPVIGLASNLIEGLINKKQPEKIEDVELMGDGIGRGLLNRTRDLSLINENKDIEGGFISTVLPLVLESLPSVISGFKELFGHGIGNGIGRSAIDIHNHGDDIYGMTYNNEHYINPVKFNEKLLNMVYKHNPNLDLHKYKVQLIDGQNIEYEQDLNIPLKRNELHLFNHLLGKSKGIGRNIENNLNDNKYNSKGIGRNIENNLDDNKCKEDNSKGIGAGFKDKVLYSKKYENIGEIL